MNFRHAMHSFRALPKWIALAGFGGFVGAACLAVIPAFFVFMMSFDSGLGDASAWMIRAAILVVPGLLAAVPLSVIYLLKRFPALYPYGAFAAVFLWGLSIFFAPPKWFLWLHH